jgi:hypothetical protein
MRAMEQQIVNSLIIAFGIVVIVVSTGFAIRTFMVPSGAPPLINRFIFRLTQAIFSVITRLIRSEARRHGVLSLYAPISLLAVLAAILALIGAGYMIAFYGAGIRPLIQAFLFSASALSTLGFESPGNNFWVIVLSAAEALTVATIVALLIGYLPNIYSSYQEREQAVSALDALTGAPPDGIKVVDAYVASFGPAKFGDLWQQWLVWFENLSSAGSTLSGELYLRSSRWDRSWISAAGAVLDAAALVDSSIDLATDPAADRLVQNGAKALLQVLEPLRLQCPASAAWPATPINVTQDEFEQAYDHFQQAGLPMKPDKHAAWQTFAQHRAQYECPLMTLIRLKRPPRGARWTTDRDEAERPLAIPIVGSAPARTAAPSGSN